MKKWLSLVLATAMTASLCACGSAAGTGEAPKTEDAAATEAAAEGDGAAASAEGVMPAIAKEDIKVGVIHITDPAEGSGYTYTHDQGIVGMQKNLGLDDSQIIRKNNVNDSDATAIENAMRECVEEGCNIIFATSWGFMDTCEALAEEFPDVIFSHGTGYKSNGVNFNNYFGRIYQARYLSGIVAGLKTETNKIGYVSAMGSDNSECTGGVDAFAIGVESVNKKAKIYVAVTNSWYSPDDEKKASDALIKAGCDVLAQHCDTTAPQEASENNGTWAIGYNSDMSKETPKATLTSVIWNWSAYYTSYISSIINASYSGENYYGGMKESLVSLTELSSLCDDQTAEKVKEAKEKIVSGDFGVFDGVLKTNTGDSIGEEGKTLDDAKITGEINWYYHNVSELKWK